MGQRQDKTEIVYGDDCLLGWEEGKTPKYIYARFSNLVKCPDTEFVTHSTPPNDRVFKMTQKPEEPCNWIYRGVPWECGFELDAGPLRSMLWLTNNVDVDDHFLDYPPGFPDEGFVFHNRVVECKPWYGSHLGIAIVTWRLESLSVMKALNIAPANDLFMEMRPLVDGNKVYKYCKLKDGTNIAIEFESD